MKTATFRRSGPALRVKVSCSPRREGRYTVTLWEAGANREVPPSPWSGNFVNQDDDEYPLPRPNGKNDGRLLECLATVSVPPGVRPARLAVCVSQGERILAEAYEDVPAGTPAGQVLLFIELAAE